ncbi:MAG TPA: hypothetical protein VK989_04300 [Polyangia bacterium]|nr:hypothetical protein [Polyangia bacterium]
MSLLALVALLAVACSHQIGDSCQTSVDCDPSGTRACDLSQPGGYCTIQGCDETTCPSEATCVRYYPVDLVKMATNPPYVTCNPACEDLDCTPDGGAGAQDAGTGGAAPATGRQNKCTADQICLDVYDVCVERSYEQRECAKVCSSNSDCRSGYECRETGLDGSLPLSKNPLATTKFCAPYVK